MTSDRVWVNDDADNLKVWNRTNETPYHLKYLCRRYGLHIVNKENEIIYIDKGYRIKKSVEYKHNDEQ